MDRTTKRADNDLAKRALVQVLEAQREVDRLFAAQQAASQAAAAAMGPIERGEPWVQWNKAYLENARELNREMVRLGKALERAGTEYLRLFERASAWWDDDTTLQKAQETLGPDVDVFDYCPEELTIPAEGETPKPSA